MEFSLSFRIIHWWRIAIRFGKTCSKDNVCKKLDQTKVKMHQLFNRINNFANLMTELSFFVYIEVILLKAITLKTSCVVAYLWLVFRT